MAATGKTPILLYGSTTATNVPVAGNLTNSSDGCEIAINVADKNLFFKDSTNAVNTVPIRQSSASSNGWLSSTDWSTFNSKQPAGTYVTSVTGTAPVVSSGGTTPAISMAAANGSTNGYLTSTDWTTFNNKQPAGSYALTTGTLAQFAATTSAQLAGVISDETGSGSLVFGTSPTFSTSMTLGGTSNPYITFATTSSVATNMFQIIGASYTGTPPYNKNRLVCINSSNLAVETAGSESMVVSYTGDVTVSKGNLVIGTSGKGIDFSATAGTGTSELLADYEEGTWTPTDASGAGLSLTVADANYTKIGRCVYLSARITYPVTASGLTATIGGLPYTANSSNRTGLSIGYNTLAVNLYPSISVSATSMLLYKLGGTAALNSELSTLVFVFSGYYFV